MLNLTKTLLLATAIMLGFGATAQAGLKSETVTYTVDGQELTGYLVYDEAISGKRPGVIVVHEWWGHDAYARSRAEKLAAEGYTAFALDMYGTGKLADHPKDAGAMVKEVFAKEGRMVARFNAALDIIKAHETVDATKTGAIGYCFGGNVILNMARAGADLNAVAAFHASLGGIAPDVPSEVKAKVRVYNGADDPFIKPENLEAFNASMAAAGANYEYIAYPGVVHSFTNPEASARGEKLGLPLKYDEKADTDSWMQAMDLFKEAF
ncbi:MAG: dienelactone hydrolase family protein [Magnetovibrionaceae bacterium]